MYSDLLYSCLTSHAGLSAMVSTRVYPVKTPTDTQLPCITYAVITTEMNNNLAGTDVNGRRRVTFELHVITKTYTQSRSVLNEVVSAISTATNLSGTITDVQDYTDEDTFVTIIEVDITA